jgi:aspartyl-tRNA(Asn)/glutamyl-tRNA(Gln) amidotransferase subunit A
MENLDAPVDEFVRPRILEGRNIKAHEYISAVLTRQEHITMMLNDMRGLAGLVLPTLRTAAIPITEVDQGDTPAHLTRPFNYLAMCALSVPMGLTAEGLPGGLQIAVRGGDEALALRIGVAFEDARGAFARPSL